MATAADPSTKTMSDTHPGPVIVDLGKKPRKQIRQAREGAGKLMDEVKTVVEELRASGAVAAGAQPVLIIVRQRRRKPRMIWPLG